MTATNALSTAILKRRYKSGVSKAQYDRFPVYAEVNKKTDWDGDDYAFAIETENPQGWGTDIPLAQAGAAQSRFYRGAVTRNEFYALVRIKGQALRTATMRGDAALVDLWQHELDGIERTFLKMMEIYTFGTGNGVLGTIASGIGTVTITLSVAEDVACLDVGAKIQLVSDTTLSPTVRGGTGTITALNRSTGTVTLAAAWNVTFTGGVDGDSIIRAGDAAAAGANRIPAGWRQWLIGGATPGTWKGITRNDDPVRLASQTLDMTGLPMAEAIIDLESMINFQGKEPKLRLVGNPRDFRQVKKTLYGKVQFPSAGGTATIGFDGAKWTGSGGDIPALLSPFCPLRNVFLKKMDTYYMASAGSCPMALEGDGLDMIRLATDDAYESRIGAYGDAFECAPVESARGTGWGA